MQAWKTLATETEADANIYLHRSMVPGGAKAQFRYYGNRDWKPLRGTKVLTLSSRLREADALGIDLVKVAPADVQKLLKTWSEATT